MNIHLDALAGNEALKRQLCAQGGGRGFAHAYLICGPAGAGKRTLARLLAAAMVCSGAEDRPCGRCSDCKKTRSGIHPDVICVGGEGKGLSVDLVRSIRSDAYIRPNEAGRKVYLIESAQAMNPSAQNALLKLLEEGPAYAAFLLLTDNPGALLPTIRSRCECLSLSPVPLEEAENYLLGRFPGRDRAQLHQAALRCGGWLGQAVDELEGSRDDAPLRDSAGQLLKLLAQGDELELAAWCVSLESWDREELSALLGQAVVLLRDVLALQAGRTASDPDQLPLLRQAAALEQKKLLRCIQILEQLQQAAAFYVGGGHLCGALSAQLSQAVRS